MCENRALMRISGLKRDEVTGGWRKFITRSFVNALFTEYYQDDQIKEDGRDM
jgi:hypothetical protein